ncbi:toxin-antitoxin system YwqK family antitoxin [Pedobacter sp. JCM 36344]|uniref:toxin-antitoxin system YwqK family antitoxin n=1 Tax=Pedobacter sp. JCM 36344 TaxID=3374280 RepID=UPI003977F47A
MRAGKILSLLLVLLVGVIACKFTGTGSTKKYTDIHNPGFVYQQDTLYLNRELYSGYIYALHLDGDTALLKRFNNGIEDGITRIWYPGRLLAEERFYEMGRKSYIHRGWWPNGRIKFRYEFKEGEFDGTVVEWYETGKLFKRFHYSKGHEDGAQQMWWINGIVRANYVIKSSRRYGLLGTKNCVNDADSVFTRL